MQYNGKVNKSQWYPNRCLRLPVTDLLNHYTVYSDMSQFFLMKQMAKHIHVSEMQLVYYVQN